MNRVFLIWLILKIPIVVLGQINVPASSPAEVGALSKIVFGSNMFDQYGLNMIRSRQIFGIMTSQNRYKGSAIDTLNYFFLQLDESHRPSKEIIWDSKNMTTTHYTYSKYDTFISTNKTEICIDSTISFIESEKNQLYKNGLLVSNMEKYYYKNHPSLFQGHKDTFYYNTSNLLVRKVEVYFDINTGALTDSVISTYSYNDQGLLIEYLKRASDTFFSKNIEHGGCVTPYSDWIKIIYHTIDSSTVIIYDQYSFGIKDVPVFSYEHIYKRLYKNIDFHIFRYNDIERRKICINSARNLIEWNEKSYKVIIYWNDTTLPASIEVVDDLSIYNYYFYYF